MKHAQWRDVCQTPPKVSYLNLKNSVERRLVLLCCAVKCSGSSSCSYSGRIVLMFMVAFYCRNGSPSMCFCEANGLDRTRYCGFVWRSHFGTKEY